MQAEKPAVDKVWTLSTPPLAGQTHDEQTLPGSQKQPSAEDRRREFAFVMSSPQPLVMNE
jgi:hypothetical protein